MARKELPDEFPAAPGEDSWGYTERLIGLGQARGYWRQCSIGYHTECSVALGYADPGSCKCPCHTPDAMD